MNLWLQLADTNPMLEPTDPGRTWRQLSVAEANAYREEVQAAKRQSFAGMPLGGKGFGGKGFGGKGFGGKGFGGFPGQGWGIGRGRGRGFGTPAW